MTPYASGKEYRQFLPSCMCSNPGYVTSFCLCGLISQLSGLFYRVYMDSLLGSSPFGWGTIKKLTMLSHTVLSHTLVEIFSRSFIHVIYSAIH